MKNTMNETKQKGLVTELQCELAFSQLGILLSQPIVDDSRYDYIADLNNHFIRIQCKTSSISEDGSYFKFATRSTRCNSGENIVRGYTKNEIDYFYTYMNGKSYLIPVEECSAVKTLRLLPTKNNQPFNKAEDYEIDKILRERENFNNFSYNEIHIIEKTKTNYESKNKCKECGKPITNKATLCEECYRKNRRVVERPSRNELKKLIRLLPFIQIGNQYGVSDNAIRKWCDSYNLPRKKNEINNFSDEEWENI